MLFELVRDIGSQLVDASCELGKWQDELSQVAMELIVVSVEFVHTLKFLSFRFVVMIRYKFG